jgi:hypothetical protein
MKRWIPILLLLVSGVAHAEEPIAGAFGFVFGQVYKEADLGPYVKKPHLGFPEGVNSIPAMKGTMRASFLISAPVPFEDFSYLFMTTTDYKLVYIKASRSYGRPLSPEEGSNQCDAKAEEIVDIIRRNRGIDLKYGQEPDDEYKLMSNDWKWQQGTKNTPDWRSIHVSCHFKEVEGGGGYFRVSVSYENNGALPSPSSEL